jgi:glycosyltransferase involved in cell wall biosynthesis
VLAQDYPQLEVIVVDDGSKDDTAEIVATRYPQLTLIRKANGGAATARNAGIRAARGEFVAFLDADDIWLPGKLRAQVDYFCGHPDVAMNCTGFSQWVPDERGGFPDPWSVVPDQAEVTAEAIDNELSGWIYHKLLLDNFVWTSTVMMRQSLINAIGFYDESLRLGQDYDYFLRASRETEVHRLSRVYALYRRHPRSATARGTVNYAAQILQRARDTWGLASPNGERVSSEALRDRIHRLHFNSGYQCYRNGKAAVAFDEFRMAVLVKPLDLKSWVFAIMAGARTIFQ